MIINLKKIKEYIDTALDRKADKVHTHPQYLTDHQDISSKEDKTNKSNSISSDTGSTTKYPTIKAVEDYAQPKGNYSVTVTKLSNATTGYIATYEVKQGNVSLGKIDIPKDYLIKSGSVKSVTTANNPVNGYAVGDKYIDFIINTKDSSGTDEHIYINVKDLIDTYEPVTISSNGLMTAEDKVKLNGIAEEANKYVHPSGTAKTGNPDGNKTPGFGDTFTVTQFTSNNTGHISGATNRTVKIPNTEATTSKAGLMSANDKTKLNGVATGATNNTVENVLTSDSTTNALSAKQGKELKAQIDGIVAGTIATDHNHDSRYYTEYEVDTKLNGKAASVHTHDYDEIDVTDVQTNIDYNNYKTQGLYKIWWDHQQNNTNRPSTSGGLLKVEEIPNGYAQTFYCYGANNNQVFYRTYYHPSTTWNGWIRIDGQDKANSSHTHPDTQITWNGSALAGSVSPIDMAMYEEFSANRLAYLPGGNITVEYSTNAGSTWNDYGATTEQKTALVTTAQTFIAGKGATANKNNQLRITINAGGGNNVASNVYLDTRKLMIYFSTAGGTGTKVKIETSTYGTSTTWSTVGTYNIAGYSGWNSYPLAIRFGGMASQTTGTRIQNIRLTFTTESAHNFNVSQIKLFGENCWLKPSNLANNGHMYIYNENQDVTFPAKIIKSGGTSSQLLLANGDTKATGDFATNGHTHTTSNITNFPTSMTPTAHATNSTTYGGGTSSNYGHVKVSDNYTSSAGNASQSIAASSAAVKSVYDVANGKTVTLTKLDTATSGYIATYEIKQGTTSLGKIDIPKDYLVKSGTVKTVSTANSPVNGYAVNDKYIDFVINTKDSSGTDEHVYINVKDLIDVYTADNSSLQLSNSNQFSIKSGGVTSSHIKDGTIVNGDIADTTITGGKLVNSTITATQLASDAVETAKIKNGNVTKAKLNNDVIVPEYIVGTHGTGATSAWTGTSSRITSLNDGQLIFFKMTSAAASGTAVTLELTLADGTTKVKKNVQYRAGTNLTTHFPQNTVLCLVYDATAGVWITTEIQDTNQIDRHYAVNQIKAGQAISAYQLAGGCTDRLYYKLAANLTIDIRYPILYVNGAVAANGTSYNVYNSLSSVNLQSTISGKTVTSGEKVYVEGILNENLFTISNNVFVSENSVELGKYYIPIGVALSTTNIRFNNYDNKIYKCTDATNKTLIPIELDMDELNLLTGTQAFNTPAPSGSSLNGTYNGCNVRYLKNTGSSYIDFSWTIPYAQLESSGYYVLSFWAKTTTAHSKINTFFYSGNVNSRRIISNSNVSGQTGTSEYGDGNTNFGLTTDWKRYYVVYQLNTTAPGTSNKTLAIRLYNDSAQPDIYLAGVKFEKGNTPTKWSENPNTYSKVSVSPTKTSGVEIGRITVDGTEKILYQQDNNTTYTAASAAPLRLSGNSAVVGTSAKYAREDHRHPRYTNYGESNTTADGYFKLFRVSVGSWCNQPFIFKIIRRGAKEDINYQLRFTNVNVSTTLPTVSTLYNTGEEFNLWVYDNQDKTFDIIVKEPETYFSCNIEFYDAMNLGITDLKTRLTATEFNNLTASRLTKSTYIGFTSTEKTKLAGIATGANNYSHPSTQQCTHSHNYLPLSGGTLTGAVIHPQLRVTNDNLPYSGTFTWDTNWLTTVKNRKSLIGSVADGNSLWWNVLSIRHRNGSSDGNAWGMYLKSMLTNNGDLIWQQDLNGNSSVEKTLLDTNNISYYVDDNFCLYIDAPSYERTYKHGESFNDLIQTNNSIPLAELSLTTNGLQINSSTSTEKAFFFPVVNPTSLEYTYVSGTHRGFYIGNQSNPSIFWGFGDGKSWGINNTIVTANNVSKTTSTAITANDRIKLAFESDKLNMYRNGTLELSCTVGTALDGVDEYYIGFYTNNSRKLIIKDVTIK